MIEDLRCFLKKWLLKPCKPGPIYVIKEQLPASPANPNMTQFKLQVALPPTVDGDVASREFSYKINAAEPVVISLAATEVSFELFAIRDANIHLQLIDIDVAGNRSEPSVRDFVVTDTFAPHKPGELGVTVVDQVELP